MGKKIKIKVVARVAEVSSEKQRNFMCAMTSDDADRRDDLSKSEAEEMCNASSLIEDRTRDEIIKIGKSLCGYLNCKLFVQELTGISKIKELPSKRYNEKKLKVGDILAWPNGLHYAIYIGKGEVMEVEEWGGSPRIAKLSDLIEEMGQPEFQYDTKGR